MDLSEKVALLEQLVAAQKDLIEALQKQTQPIQFIPYTSPNISGATTGNNTNFGPTYG